MTELELIVLIFFILYILLLAINYMAFTRYPDRLRELGLGGSILESKGPGWFVITKAVIFLALLLIFLALMPFLPTRYSYLFFGILIGTVYFNLINDYLKYKQAERERKR